MASLGAREWRTYMPGTYIQLLDKTLSTEEQECAIHAVARQCARWYMEPVATAHSHEALFRALASQPRYADVLATLYEWVSACLLDTSPSPRD